MCVMKPAFDKHVLAGRMARLETFIRCAPAASGKVRERLHGSAALLIVDSLSGSHERTAWWAIKRCFCGYWTRLWAAAYVWRYRLTGADPDGIFQALEAE